MALPPVRSVGNANHVADHNSIVAEFATRRQVYNVKEYGALGDGSTDDTTAVQAAIDAATTGGNVFFPPGTYRMKKVDVDTGDARAFTGVPGKSILKAHNTDMGSATLLMNFLSVTDISVDGLVFDGNAATLTSYTNCIVVFNSQRVIFTRCRVQNVRGIGMLLSTNIQDLTIDNCSFDTIGFVGGVGAGSNRWQAVAFTETTVGNGVRNRVTNSNFTNIGLDCISFDLQVLGTVSGNVCNVTGAAGVYGRNLKQVTIADNVIRSGPGTATPDANGIDIIGVSTAGATTADFVTITGNVCYENSANGISLGASTRNFTVTGNVCVNNDLDNGAIRRGGMTIIGTGHAVSGNVCTDTQGVKTQDYGILIDTAATNISIGPNQLQGNATAEYATFDPVGAPTVIVRTGNTVPSATTVTLSPYNEVALVTGTTTITSITAAPAGRRVTLVFAGILTFTDGSNLKLAGNFVTTADDSISLISDGTNWIETGRSVN